MSSEALAKLIEAVAALAWPAAAIFVIFFIKPFLLNIRNAEDVKIKVGDFEVSVKSSVDEINRDIADIKSKISALEGSRTPKREPNNITIGTQTYTSPFFEKKMIWVDDKPEGNANQLSQLTDKGAQVMLARSTSEAMEKIAKYGPFDILLSDIGRREDGKYKNKAGVEFLNELREIGNETPVVFLTTSKTASMKDIQEELENAGNASITSSPVDFFRLITLGLKQGQISVDS